MWGYARFDPTGSQVAGSDGTGNTVVVAAGTSAPRSGS